MPRLHPRKASFRRRRGALTLEWVLLCTVLIIGTVGGVAAVRNALILEYQEMIETILSAKICGNPKLIPSPEISCNICRPRRRGNRSCRSLASWDRAP